MTGPEWRQSLYTGAPGIALWHIERARTGVGDWATVHEWTRMLIREPVTAYPDACGLDYGAPAIAFALRAAERPGYAPALETLDRHIGVLVRYRLDRAYQRIRAGRLPALREYDLIHGLTGLGVYLLRQRTDRDLMGEVLSYLVRLARPITVDGTALPGWWTAHGPADRPSPNWPGGHANLGLAHGIVGPLALLATATRRGIVVPGQYEAIGRIVAWYDRWRIGTGPGAHWPAMVTASEYRAGTVRWAEPHRPSWCYGTPGLARAHQLAALALDDPRGKRVAETALAGCVTDPRQLAQLATASLCHGWAGLVLATWRVAADADDPDRFDVPGLTRRLDERVERHGPPIGTGLLDGMAGVELARYTVTADRAPVSGWDACLLLDGDR